MKDKAKTKEQLIAELEQLRQKVTEDDVSTVKHGLAVETAYHLTDPPGTSFA